METLQNFAGPFPDLLMKERFEDIDNNLTVMAGNIATLQAASAIYAVNTQCLTNPALAMDLTEPDFIIATGNGTYVINGIIRAWTAMQAGTVSYGGSAGEIIPTAQKAAVFVFKNAAAANSVIVTAPVVAAAAIVVPTFDLTTLCPIGAVVISNASDSNFVLGTTNLDATSITATYININRVTPGQSFAW